MKENGKSDKILAYVKVQTDNTHGIVEYLVLRKLGIIVEFGIVKVLQRMNNKEDKPPVLTFGTEQVCLLEFNSQVIQRSKFKSVFWFKDS